MFLSFTCTSPHYSRGLCQVIFVTLKLSGSPAFTAPGNAATMWHVPPSSLVRIPGWPVGKSPPGAVETSLPNTMKYKYNLGTTTCRKPSFLTWFPVPLRCWMETPEFRGSTGRVPCETVISTWTGVRGRLKPRRPLPSVLCFHMFSCREGSWRSLGSQSPGKVCAWLPKALPLRAQTPAVVSGLGLLEFSQLPLESHLLHF